MSLCLGHAPEAKARHAQGLLYSWVCDMWSGSDWLRRGFIANLQGQTSSIRGKCISGLSDAKHPALSRPSWVIQN